MKRRSFLRQKPLQRVPRVQRRTVPVDPRKQAERAVWMPCGGDRGDAWGIRRPPGKGISVVKKGRPGGYGCLAEMLWGHCGRICIIVKSGPVQGGDRCPAVCLQCTCDCGEGLDAAGSVSVRDVRRHLQRRLACAERLCRLQRHLRA